MNDNEILELSNNKIYEVGDYISDNYSQCSVCNNSKIKKIY